MNKRSIVIAAAALAAVGGLGAFLWLRPRSRGLATPVLVLVSGDVRIDASKGKVADVVPVGAWVRTGALGSACFSLHAGRVCLGTQAGVRLASLDATAATLDVERGTVVVGSSTEVVAVKLSGGAVQIAQGTTAIEASASDVTVRALDGSATVTAGSRPPAVIAATSAFGLADGKPRPSLPALEAEEREALAVARSWQGTAGATLDVRAQHGRVEVDGHDVGHAPASFLLSEGSHTVVIHSGPHDVTKKTLDLSAGQKAVIDG
jgi:hypothetical protein